MEIKRPKKLQKGDTIGILAVSGRIKEFERINNAKNFFTNLGYNVVISSTCENSHSYMAGKSDEDCLCALHDFFSRPDINAILCARGGYGTLRLINKINWNIIADNPKIFAGYSDITVLLAMFYKKCGLITFHSPMANGDFADDINEYTKSSFFNTLSGNINQIKAYEYNVYREGDANGILWGGNLSSIVSLCGTDFVPDEDIILFLEDLNEPVYKIDKMLTQLFNVDKIRQKVKGIAFGKFSNIADYGELQRLFAQISSHFKIPVADGFNISHEKTKDTVPFGVLASFNSREGTISFSNNYVIC